MTYVERIAERVYFRCREEGDKTWAKLPRYQQLLYRMYALLVLTKGMDTTNEHVHDAWSVWETQVGLPWRRSIVPYDQLPPEVQEMDTRYTEAIIRTTRDIHDGIIVPFPPEEE